MDSMFQSPLMLLKSGSMPSIGDDFDEEKAPTFETTKADSVGAPWWGSAVTWETLGDLRGCSVDTVDEADRTCVSWTLWPCYLWLKLSLPVFSVQLSVAFELQSCEHIHGELEVLRGLLADLGAGGCCSPCPAWTRPRETNTCQAWVPWPWVEADTNRTSRSRGPCGHRRKALLRLQSEELSGTWKVLWWSSGQIRNGSLRRWAGPKMRRPFQNEWGRIFMLDKVKDGWMQSSLLIAIVFSPARHDHGLARDPRAPPISESTKISFAELNLRLQKEGEGKCEGVLLVSLSSCSSFAASFLFVRGSHWKRAKREGNSTVGLEVRQLAAVKPIERFWVSLLWCSQSREFLSVLSELVSFKETLQRFGVHQALMMCDSFSFPRQYGVRVRTSMPNRSDAIKLMPGKRWSKSLMMMSKPMTRWKWWKGWDICWEHKRCCCQLD